MDLFSTYPDLDSSQFDSLLDALEQSKVLTYELLSLSPAEIARKCRRSAREVEALKSLIASYAEKDISSIAFTSGDALLAKEESNVFSTGDPEIDALLGGGIRTGTITEVVGEAGAGKTHFLTQLCLAVQNMPEDRGLARAAIYLSTEKHLPQKRLVDISVSIGGSADAILVYKCNSVEDLERMLLLQVPRAVDQYDIGLVVIDSIAQLFRGLGARFVAKRIAPLMAKVRKLCLRHNFALVVANQVTSAFRKPVASGMVGYSRDPFLYDHQIRWFSGWTQPVVYSVTRSQLPTPKPQPSQELGASRPPPSANSATGSLSGTQSPRSSQPDTPKDDILRPYCGMAWTNSVDTRIVFKKAPDGTRTMNVVFSSWSESNVELEFEISVQGIRSVSIEE
ncbi:DNA repair protein Rad57p [Trichomonascus vanleenenianus]|uniref:putative DNA-dependent ATPase RAD57 n=1 Tax=Trichomonascus vanleenenianus TaxID=2268995 RepID=UPI003ECA18DB